MHPSSSFHPEMTSRIIGREVSNSPCTSWKKHFRYLSESLWSPPELEFRHRSLSQSALSSSSYRSVCCFWDISLCIMMKLTMREICADLEVFVKVT
ncbi:hypothetical protein CDAR_428631 [Caerostris darwini]|uniref:Uncharacterized protein n=1 Tax=Caerostris darwini TaxID=1538125 RepID=A0AAV4S0E5_9ARAC|nr:hypothetical protein CDAR_428631 [Caerostris darwini]